MIFSCFFLKPGMMRFFHGSVSLPEGLIRGFHQICAFFFDSHGNHQGFFQHSHPADLDQPSCPYYLGRWERIFSQVGGFLYHQIRWVVEPTHLKKNVGLNGFIFHNFRSENKKIFETTNLDHQILWVVFVEAFKSESAETMRCFFSFLAACLLVIGPTILH